MKSPIRLLALSIILLSGCDSSTGQDVVDTKPDVKPNILLILVDDLGYTDLGIYGGNVDTPNIDALAHESIIFTNAHAYTSCAPTRASLMTGQDPHRVGLGSQNGFAAPGVSINTPGYKGSLEGKYTGIAELLSKAGYKSYQSGKWHLGYTEETSPGGLGFDKNYTMLDGAASHYSDMKTTALTVSATGKASYERNGEKLDLLPDDFYSTRNFTEELMSMLKEHGNEEAPFFAYLAYTAVHDPLHALENLITKYLERYDGDVIALRKARIGKAVENGVLTRAGAETRWLPDFSQIDGLNDLAIRDLRYRMAVYGAMIEYVDTEVGRLIDYLKATDQYENTLILLMSDNGPASQPRTVYNRNAEERAWQAQAYPNNSLKDYGSPKSFPTLGILNAQAVSGPWMGTKASGFEGGTRIPMIVKAPNSNVFRLAHTFMHIVDIYPTLAEFAGVEPIDDASLLGDSAKSYIEGISDDIGDSEFGMEFLGTRVYHSGHWKLIFAEPAFGGTGDWALYNLEDDPGETIDLAHIYPDRVSELALKWYRYADENGVVVPPMGLLNTFGEITRDARLSTDWADE